jgi:hypothetical protein
MTVSLLHIPKTGKGRLKILEKGPTWWETITFGVAFLRIRDRIVAKIIL